MRVLLIVALLVSLASCGKDPFAGEDLSNHPEDPSTAAATFSGYVQKAFAITVDGEKFDDSEQFYTNFIPALILPHYAVPVDAMLTVEGQYGMDEFGSNAWVFMTPTQNEGDLFQAQTDSYSKFTIQVTDAALNSTYKARLVIRIGLLVTQVGSDPDHFCYVLTGARDNIALTDKSKPIIFDVFTTQLNTYKCDQVTDSQLVIPSLKKIQPTPIPDTQD